MNKLHELTSLILKTERTPEDYDKVIREWLDVKAICISSVDGEIDPFFIIEVRRDLGLHGKGKTVTFGNSYEKTP